MFSNTCVFVVHIVKQYTLYIARPTSSELSSPSADVSVYSEHISERSSLGVYDIPGEESLEVSVVV